MPPPSDAQAIAFRATQLGHVLNVCAQVLLGAATIALSTRVAGWLVPDGPPLTIEVYASELSALGFGLVGLFVLIQGAENIVAAVYTVFTRPSWPAADNAFWYVWEPQRQTIVRALVQIAAGVLLMFGRSGLVNAWWCLRSYGVVKEGSEVR
jgi:hypothetical protein